MSMPWHSLVVAAGFGQLALVAASLAIPRLLRWPEDVARLRPLTRQVFWTYAGYIWSTNLAFGLLSALGPRLLLDGSSLAGWVSAFMATYWGARVVIQFAYFDRSGAPKGPLFTLGEVALVGLFVGLAGVYGGIAAMTLGGRWA